MTERLPHVVEKATFSVTPHARGAVLAVLSDAAVLLNIRIDEPTAWALMRALREANQAQRALEMRAEQEQR
jgi:hypothetical protein